MVSFLLGSTLTFKRRKKMLYKSVQVFAFVFMLFAQQCTAFSLYDTTYRQEAEQWSSSYLYDKQGDLLVPVSDLQLIANLCYFSFMRSYCTLKAQKIALKTVTAVWKGWQNIACKRLDPSGDTPYKIHNEQKEKTMELFWKAHDEHYIVGATYSRTVDAIVHGDALTTVKALKGIHDMRSRARSVVAQALLDVRSLLGNLFYTPQKKSLGSLWEGWSFVKHLSTYIPQLALSSFVEANNLNNAVSTQAWKTVEMIQHIGVQTWEKIEEARASFYLAHYCAVCTVVEKLQLEVPCMFDYSDPLCREKQKKLLPSQENLRKFVDEF